MTHAIVAYSDKHHGKIIALVKGAGRARKVAQSLTDGSPKGITYASVNRERVSEDEIRNFLAS